MSGSEYRKRLAGRRPSRIVGVFKRAAQAAFGRTRATDPTVVDSPEIETPAELSQGLSPESLDRPQVEVDQLAREYAKKAAVAEDEAFLQAVHEVMPKAGEEDIAAPITPEAVKQAVEMFASPTESEVVEPTAAEPAAEEPALPVTPEQRRAEAQEIAAEVLHLDEENYQGYMEALGKEDPVLYAIVVDEISNLTETAQAQEEADSSNFPA